MNKINTAQLVEYLKQNNNFQGLSISSEKE